MLLRTQEVDRYSVGLWQTAQCLLLLLLPYYTGKTYTTGPIIANCTVAALLSGSAVEGVCGSASGGIFTSAPTAELCSSGTASAASGSDPWAWSCQVSNGGTTANCSVSAAAIYKVEGKVNNAAGASMSNVLITLSGDVNVTTYTEYTDSNGNYKFTGLPNGSYKITPSKTGKSFRPANITVTISGANVTAQNFKGKKGDDLAWSL